MSDEAKIDDKSEVYRFGDCIVDADRREILHAGKPVTTQPKAFELLLYLIRNRQRAVDKDELQDSLWPRSIVTETALTRCVMKARRAAGDDADRQAVIRTVHGHGYRFVAELADAPGGAQTPAPPEPATRESRHWKAAGMAAAVLIAIAALWWYLSPPAISGPVRVAVLPVDNATGDTELDWVRTGLMALMDRMLEDQGIDVVSSGSVTGLAGERGVDELIADHDGFRVALAKTTAATHLLGVKLESDGGLYRLTYSLSEGRERPQRRTVVGKEPAALVNDVVETIATLVLRGAPPPDRMSFISVDPFLNETYARAMSFEFEGRYEEAQRMFQVIIDQDPASFWPRYEYALCARNRRDFTTAEQILSELDVQTAEAGDSLQNAAVNNALGVLYMTRNQNDAARAALEKTIGIAGDTGNARYAATALQNLALIEKNTGDIHLAREHMLRSLELYESMDIEALPGSLQNNLAGIFMQLGDLEQAKRYSVDAIEYFELTGQRLYASYAMSRTSNILRMQGALDEAEDMQLAAMSVREELGDESGAAGSLISLAAIAEQRGDLTRARQYAQDAWEMGVRIDDAEIRIGALLRIGSADLELGRPREATESFKAAEALARNIESKADVYAARRYLAQAWLAEGDAGGAAAIAEELLQDARTRDHRRHEAGAMSLQAEILMATMQWQQAAGKLDEVLAIANEIGDDGIAASVNLKLANAWLALGEVDRAAAYIDVVARDRPADAGVIVLQARLAAERGETGEAVRLMTLARSNAGEAWGADDDALLEKYRIAARPAE